MITKGLIYKNYKISNKDILHLIEESPDDEIYFAFDNDLEENQTSSLLFIDTQETPVSNFEENLSNRYSLKSIHHNVSDYISAKILSLKAFFIDEIYIHFDKIFHLCRKNITKPLG